MKGVVFTELFELLAEKFGDDFVDELLLECDLDSGGSYTTVGSYSYEELQTICLYLVDKLQLPLKDILVLYAGHLFRHFTVKFTEMIDCDQDCFSFLESIDSVIHVEVRKLYADAELPRFETYHKDGKFYMQYTSQRQLSSLAYGMILAAIEHFGEKIEVEMVEQSTDTEGKALFVLEKMAA